MNAMEKVSWAELTISLVTLVAAALLIPWLGNGALGAFGLLGFLGLTVLFLRRKGQCVVVDERDHEIDQRARFLGVLVAWQCGYLGLLCVSLWDNNGVVQTTILMWLLWSQFAVCYFVKGLVGVVSYRRKGRAA